MIELGFTFFNYKVTYIYTNIVSDLKTSAESEFRIQFSDDNGSSVNVKEIIKLCE